MSVTANNTKDEELVPPPKKIFNAKIMFKGANAEFIGYFYRAF